MDDQKSGGLTRAEILEGLEKVNAFVSEREVQGEICIYRGACLCLAFAGRVSTKDVDAIFEPASVIRKAAFEVGNEMGWDWNWLNDDVRGFVSAGGVSARVARPLPGYSHLKVYTATSEYLLAMKCLAARGGNDEEPSVDLSDAILLCRDLKVSRRSDIEAIISKYYPESEIPERTDFFVAEVLGELERR